VVRPHARGEPGPYIRTTPVTEVRVPMGTPDPSRDAGVQWLVVEPLLTVAGSLNTMWPIASGDAQHCISVALSIDAVAADGAYDMISVAARSPRHGRSLEEVSPGEGSLVRLRCTPP
jgi:hypothetical protein